MLKYFLCLVGALCAIGFAAFLLSLTFGTVPKTLKIGDGPKDFNVKDLPFRKSSNR